MRQQRYRVVVIGGGVIGASVLYHLAALGWSDIVLIERSELTAGSTWHAAADFHTFNADPEVAALQKYTIDLYPQLEAETGVACGRHLTGGISLAATADRWQALQAEWAICQTFGTTAMRLVDRDEIARLAPIVDLTGIHGGLFNPDEGHIDASAVTTAYVSGAKARGAEVVLHNRVLGLTVRPDGGWRVTTEKATVTAEHVVDAGGLWARRIGRMAGVNLPVAPMEHHYLVTEPIADVQALDHELPTVVDLDGYTYLRQEGAGLLLGMYETNPKHWQVDGAPWNFGIQLLPPDVDRLEPELELAMARYPCLVDAGITRWVNGAITFTPDGNPLVGPVRGLRGFWTACGVMAGFSQGGGVGLTLAEWMVHGEPGRDASGLDVARFAPFTAEVDYLTATTRQFYSRRFVMTYPNEQLPAGRSHRVAPWHAEQVRDGARFTVSAGVEVPRYFAPAEFNEPLTLRRSAAQRYVAAEVEALTGGVAIVDLTATTRVRIEGQGAGQWLSQVLAGPLPTGSDPTTRTESRGAHGTSHEARLASDRTVAALLRPSGRLVGIATVTVQPDGYELSGPLSQREVWLRHLESVPRPATVDLRDVSEELTGFALAGPRAGELLDQVRAAPGMQVAQVRTNGVADWIELVIPRDGAGEKVYAAMRAAGAVPVGVLALESVRIEDGVPAWGHEVDGASSACDDGVREFAGQGTGMAHAVPDGRLATMLVRLQVDTADVDASRHEPVWQGSERVGRITSGAYGHRSAQSVAIAALRADLATPGRELTVHVLGEPVPATVLATVSRS